ncbi:pre-mRNA-splicing factor SYF1, putative [Entamoeba invadens IP1]|uniref:Pre-mRNA-splicing factor SYF1, putative n=1 Tax=Entamoeba invadens IP1 TaxID=370355 RepID=A0A0A1TVE4_ENTIV|nr:pre-mRNA-splicing factor SYF1, putative [Entamoeba invadens IP1]ELP84316.1 pre-mRNA-splicing factor SYF1, putative [Entamoeba invadens IP1]|eukprot:XP_004183662.1 pre-mRNA-splicing factor SYF1, putative [Entamoeba invadens IP1]
MESGVLDKFEQDVQQNHQSFKSWWGYIDLFDDTHFQEKRMIYVRALKELPMSYKLWHTFLLSSERDARGTPLESPTRLELTQRYEESVVYMSKMPTIWKNYIEWLYTNCEITQMRRVFDRALRSLPSGQHKILWGVIMKYIVSLDSPKLFNNMVTRHLKYDRSLSVEYVKVCIEKGSLYLPTAASILIKHLGSTWRVRREEYELLVQVIENGGADDVVDVESVLRHGINEYINDSGRLWVGLARWHIRQGRVESGIVVLEQAMEEVVSVRDLYIVRECYEAVISSLSQNSNDTDKDDNQRIVHERGETVLAHVMMQVNGVLLRKNPEDVSEWISRSHMYIEQGDVVSAVDTLLEGIKTVKEGINGTKSDIYSELISWYSRAGKYEVVNSLYNKAKTESLSQEEEGKLSELIVKDSVKRGDVTKALEYVEEATLKSSRIKREGSVWRAYLAVEKTRKGLLGIVSVYEKMIEIGCITAREVLEYIDLITKEGKALGIEDTVWSIYERSILKFTYPIAGKLWMKYFDDFVSKYGETKVERCRELYESALLKCPAEFKLEISKKAVAFESTKNSSYRVIELYKKIVKEVNPESLCETYLLYGQAVNELEGSQSAQKVYEEGVLKVGRREEWRLYLECAKCLIENEDVDNARDMFVKGAKRCSVKEHPEFWNTWNDFEEQFGNELTYKDLLVAKADVMGYFGEN